MTALSRICVLVLGLSTLAGCAATLRPAGYYERRAYVEPYPGHYRREPARRYYYAPPPPRREVYVAPRANPRHHHHHRHHDHHDRH